MGAGGIYQGNLLVIITCITRDKFNTSLLNKLIDGSIKDSHLENDPITRCFTFSSQHNFMFPKIIFFKKDFNIS